MNMNFPKEIKNFKGENFELINYYRALEYFYL